MWYLGKEEIVLRTAATLLVISVVALPALADDPAINVGEWTLEPDLPGQIIELFVSGGALVQGLELNVQISRDGPGGEQILEGPVLQDVDILNGTIFAESNEGIFPGSYKTPHVAYQGTTSDPSIDLGYGPGMVPTDGLLATLTVDTTGITEGRYNLLLTGTQEGTTNFAGIQALISDGTIIVPEPMSLVLLGFGSLAVVCRRRRR